MYESICLLSNKATLENQQAAFFFFLFSSLVFGRPIDGPTGGRGNLKVAGKSGQNEDAGWLLQSILIKCPMLNNQPSLLNKLRLSLIIIPTKLSAP